MQTGAKSDGFVVVVPDVDGKLGPMTEDLDLAKRVRRTCKRAKIEAVNFHALRASALTAMADSGMPISQLRAIAGHAQISTTAIYLRSDSAAAATDPRARLSFAKSNASVVAIRDGHAMDTAGIGEQSAANS